MKTIILYASKRGATKQLSQQLSQHLNGADCCDIEREIIPPLDGYDGVVLGSNLTVGQINGKMKAFVRREKDMLKHKRLGLFLSGLDKGDSVAYFEKNFPPEVLEAASAKAFLGGVYDPQKCSAPVRLLLKAAVGVTAYTSTIDEAAIKAFTDKFMQGE